MLPESEIMPVQLLLHILLTIGISFLIGMEREEHGVREHSYIVAGARTFPLIGLLGFIITFLSGDYILAPALGFIALTGFLSVSYAYKLRSGNHGATTEMAVLVVFVLGALVAHGYLQMATAIAVLVAIILQAKAPIERLATRIPQEELATFIRFLLLTVVILPVLPNHDFTQYHLNPFKTWLMVVAVSSMSYISYLVQRMLKSNQSVLLTAILGGIYSSTVTTVVLAKQSKSGNSSKMYGGAIIISSSIMFLRMAILLWLFNHGLGNYMGLRLVGVSLVGVIIGGFITWLGQRQSVEVQELQKNSSHNPLELPTALSFAGLFVVITVLTKLSTTYLGNTGIYALAVVSGVVDVDALLLSVSQTAGVSTPMMVAVIAILLAALSNNLMKGIYAIVFGHRKVGLIALSGLITLALLAFATLLI